MMIYYLQLSFHPSLTWGDAFVSLGTFSLYLMYAPTNQKKQMYIAPFDGKVARGTKIEVDGSTEEDWIESR